MLIMPMTTHFWLVSTTDVFKEPFNQATVINYDPVNPVIFNNMPIPPAQTISGVVYPTQFKINLNVGEVNTTNYTVDVQNSATANVWIIYTQYKGVETAPNKPYNI